MRTRLRIPGVAVLALVLAFAGPLLAQGTTGSIIGRVMDAQSLAVPGATVTATGTQGAKSTTTDSEGRFVIPFLTPGVYAVRAELQGFKTVERQNVNVSLGQAFDVALKMDVGGVTETVEVTASTTALNVTSTTIGQTLDTDSLRQIPVGRTFAQALYLTPGVSSSGTLGQANPSISGGSGLENQYVVDGANVTNTGYGGLGSYSIIFGSLGNATPYDFIKEIEVKTGGYESEFGQATGGVVNVVTKSGTNAIRGSAFGYSQPSGLEAEWERFESTNGSVQTVATHQSDFGAEGGFPVIKDRLFFFGAIDPSWRTTTFNAPPGPSFPLNALGDVDRNRRTTSYAVKGTYQLSSAHRIDVSFFGDPSHGANGPQRTSALLVADTSSFSTLDYGGHQQAYRYSGVVTSAWLVEGSYARSLNKISELPSVDTWRYTDQTVTPTQITGGIGRYEAGNRSESNQYTAKTTYIIGGHQVKGGVNFDDATYAQINQLTGPTFTAPDGRQTATGAGITVLPDPVYGKIYRVTRANFNSERNTPQTYVSFFAQDSWRVNSHITVNPGLRYEQEKLSGTIIQDWQLKNNWAPRIGVVADLAGDGRSKIYGNYGRFYARIPNDLAARALSADDGFTRGDYFDANLTRVVPEGTLAANVTRHFILAGTGADEIDSAAKLTYTNEYVLGADREIMTNMTVGVRYVHRDMPRVLEDIANCPMVAYDLGIAACDSVEYILTNPSSSFPMAPGTEYLGAKFDDPVHKYDSVEFTINRRGSSWSAMGSYRWSRLRGNFEGFYRDDNGQSDPGISSLYDFPTNDPSYTAIGGPQFGYQGDIRYLGDKNGILPLDRPHQIKLYGNHAWGSGFNLGGALNLSSGKPLTPFAANPNYDSNGEIPEAARGTGIQTIDGFVTRSPFESQLDMQASYTLRLSGARRVTFLADIFNVFNERRVLSYDQNTQLSAGTPDLDFGKPISTILGGNPPQFQAPFNMRIGVRLEF
jgi:Carboxypeptidase regulatory-like domain/TonB-dependent Receptor Plug Domain